MSYEPTHIVDPYAYAALRAAADGNRRRTRLYVTNTQRRKLEEMVDAGWIRFKDDGRAELTDPGIAAMEHMERLIADLGDDAWIGLIDSIDSTQDRRGSLMREHQREKRAMKKEEDMRRTEDKDVIG